MRFNFWLRSPFWDLTKSVKYELEWNLCILITCFPCGFVREQHLQDLCCWIDILKEWEYDMIAKVIHYILSIALYSSISKYFYL